MPYCDEPSPPRDPPNDTGRLPLAQIMDLLLDAVCVVGADGCFLYVSTAFERIFGYWPDEVVGRPMIDLVVPDDRERTLNRVEQLVADDGDQTHFENRYLRKDGRVVDIMWSARWSAAHRVRVAVARDVTERKRAETVQAALYAVPEAAYAATDLDAFLHRVQEIVGALLPVEAFEVVLQDDGSRRAQAAARADGPQASATGRDALVAEVVRTGTTLHGTDPPIPAETADDATDAGRPVVEWVGAPLHLQDRVIGALLVECRPGQARHVHGDIELLSFVAKQVAAAIERQNAATALIHSARHDPLADLPNRNLLRDRAVAALTRSRRDATLLSLLYLDIDHFKEVNDRFGHALGDRLLREVAHRLGRCVRESDTVGRIGGDEFVVLLGRIQSPADAALIAEQIRAALGEPFDLGGHALTITASFGISHFPEHGDDYERLLHRADEAMYIAKQEGRNRMRIADDLGRSMD